MQTIKAIMEMMVKLDQAGRGVSVVEGGSLVPGAAAPVVVGGVAAPVSTTRGRARERVKFRRERGGRGCFV